MAVDPGKKKLSKGRLQLKKETFYTWLVNGIA